MSLSLSLLGWANRACRFAGRRRLFRRRAPPRVESSESESDSSDQRSKYRKSKKRKSMVRFNMFGGKSRDVCDMGRSQPQHQILISNSSVLHGIHDRPGEGGEGDVASVLEAAAQGRRGVERLGLQLDDAGPAADHGRQRPVPQDLGDRAGRAGVAAVVEERAERGGDGGVRAPDQLSGGERHPEEPEREGRARRAADKIIFEGCR